MTLLLGPMPHIICRRPVVWDRIGVSWRLLERAGRTYRAHACEPITVAASDRCAAWMPNARERCARRAGHGGTPRYPDHRTRYAMDCAARSRRTAA